MEKKKKVPSLGDFEKLLKQKDIKYKRNGDRIVAKKKKTCEDGHKLEVKLFIEYNFKYIVGTVYGLKGSKLAIDPKEAISEYQKEIAMLISFN